MDTEGRCTRVLAHLLRHDDIPSLLLELPTGRAGSALEVRAGGVPPVRFNAPYEACLIENCT